MTRRARIAIEIALAAAGALAVAVAWPHDRAAAPAAHAVAAPSPQQQVTQRRIVAEHTVAQASSLEALQTAWRDANDRESRVELIAAAAHSADDRSIALLVGIASSQDPLAAQAGAAIGHIGDHRRAAELARLAASDAPVLVRANAARALAVAGTKEQAAELAAIVASSAPLRVRQEAALALAKIGDDAAAATLGETLDALAVDATIEPLRLTIVQGLGGIATDSARAALVRDSARDITATERAFVDRALVMKPTA